MRFLVILFAFLLSIFNSASAHSETQVIEMTPSGFVPSDVTLDQNATIIFLNKDTRARWPASNVHPTHDIYPEFDPKKPIEPGGSWSFKTKKVGTFKYHDHLLPHIRGTITVISEGGQPQSSWQQNFKDFIEQVIFKIKSIFSFTKKEDAAKRWEDLKLKYKGQGGSEGNIHDQAHLAGSLLYLEKGFGGIGLCSAQFAFGCFHGFLDEAFKKDLNKLNGAYEACSKLGTGLTGPVASCIHGIGHGVASFHGTSDLKASLASCRKLTSGADYCFDGVFMEYVRSAPDSFFRKDDPLYPCNALEKEFGPALSFSCGRNQPSLLMSRFKIGFDEVVGICLSSPSKPFKEACFDALGFSLAATSDENQIIQGCGKIGVLEYILRCTKAGAGELVFQEVPLWQEKSEAVCNAYPAGRDDCLKHLDKLILDYNRKKKINFTPIQKGEDLNLYTRREIKKCYDTGGKDGCYEDV